MNNHGVTSDKGSYSTGIDPRRFGVDQLGYEQAVRHHEEQRHYNVMREWNARERDRKQWQWARQSAEDEARETERIRHENHMAEWAPAYQAWEVVKSWFNAALFIGLVWFALMLADVGGRYHKMQCLKDLEACRSHVGVQQ